MTTKVKLRAVDADAHVLESERTWEYLDADDQKYRPQTFASDDDPNRRAWVIDEAVVAVEVGLSAFSIRTHFARASTLPPPRSSVPTVCTPIVGRIDHRQAFGPCRIEKSFYMAHRFPGVFTT